MATNQLTRLDVEILRKWSRLQINAILVEGFTLEEHQLTIDRFTKYMQTKDESLSLNFLEIISQDRRQVDQRLTKVKNLFVYNMDLFGRDIEPQAATQSMNILRGAKTSGGISQLVFARPQANLDYNVNRIGYTLHYNHPLGNWFDEFYIIENGKLTSQAGPIEHRG